MKRYVCTVATGLLLALVSTGTATATGLPLPGQSGTQVTGFGDQTVGEQRNDADVTQKQGNGNLNIAPAVGILGNAETTNAQGNGNTAIAVVDQSNSVAQSQSSEQKQSLEQSGTGCCGGQSQTAEQKVYGGDQSVEKQKNEADVDQWQGNGTVNIAPAIAIFGDAETTTYQGNGNTAIAVIDQSNSVDQAQSSYQRQSLWQDSGRCCTGQSQTGEQKTSFGDQSVDKQRNDADVTQKQGNWNGSFAPALAFGSLEKNRCSSKCEKSWFPSGGNAETTNKQGIGNEAMTYVDQSNSVDQSQRSAQKQYLAQEGGSCCEPSHGCKSWDDCKPRNGYSRPTKEQCCDTGQSQAGEQKTSFDDQYVGEQRNDADVTQKQGNRNGSFAPAIAFGGGRNESCDATCETSWYPLGANAETTNKQGSGNQAVAWLDQSNSVDQSQTAYQWQSVVDRCKGLVYR